MLRLKLVKEDDVRMYFEYYPEDKELSGRISIDKSNGNIELLQQAENDEFGGYKVHAVSKIREYFNEKAYKENQIVAWN